MAQSTVTRGTNVQQRHGFFEELLLYSGQYALFYIIMNIVVSPLSYVANTGHVALLFLVIVQTYILSRFGTNRTIRFFGNFIVPAGYSLIESLEGIQFLLNTGHVGFWLFALLTALLQLLTRQHLQKAANSMLTLINILSFLYIYIYLDIKLAIQDVTPEHLEIYNFPAYIPEFLADTAHAYLLLASILLVLIIAYGRQKIIDLENYIRTAFGKYVDPSVRDRILQEHKPTRETKTILFSDLRDFTTYSESHSPRQVTTMLNAYFSVWSRVAKQHNGIIDKFIGDAVLIVFDTPQDAVNCAIAYRNEYVSVRKKNATKLPLAFGVGIHCGEVIVGDLGSVERKNYTVIGDTVNIAARLESTCKEYKRDILLSSAVKFQIHNKTTSLGQVQLKGKKKPLQLYALD